MPEVQRVEEQENVIVAVKKGETGIQSSSSHANDANKVTDLCNLAGGQDTFTSGEVVLESDRRISAIWYLGPRTRDTQVRQ
jgi:hypothetical protein